jgi:triacylglycerol esterase/lipase EstA (alpha/beta hydrolase family)
LGGSRGDLLPMECYLRLRGRRGTYRVGLGQRSVAGMSRALARYVERVLKANQAEQVDIVAHSLGGVVARLAILDCGLESKVRTLVTMGTPHQGTAQVRYVDTRLTRELHPDSPTIQRLQDARWPKGVRGVTFWSKNDLLILPPTAAAEPGTDRIDMSPFTHFSYLIDPRSWAAVQNALTG